MVEQLKPFERRWANIGEWVPDREMRSRMDS